MPPGHFPAGLMLPGYVAAGVVATSVLYKRNLIFYPLKINNGSLNCVVMQISPGNKQRSNGGNFIQLFNY